MWESQRLKMQKNWHKCDFPDTKNQWKIGLGTDNFMNQSSKIGLNNFAIWVRSHPSFVQIREIEESFYSELSKNLFLTWKFAEIFWPCESNCKQMRRVESNIYTSRWPLPFNPLCPMRFLNTNRSQLLKTFEHFLLVVLFNILFHKKSTMTQK